MSTEPTTSNTDLEYRLNNIANHTWVREAYKHRESSDNLSNIWVALVALREAAYGKGVRGYNSDREHDHDERCRAKPVVKPLELDNFPEATPSNHKFCMECRQLSGVRSWFANGVAYYGCTTCNKEWSHTELVKLGFGSGETLKASTQETASPATLVDTGMFAVTAMGPAPVMQLADNQPPRHPFKYVKPTDASIVCLSEVRDRCADLYDVLMKLPANKYRDQAEAALDVVSAMANKAIVMGQEDAP